MAWLQCLATLKLTHHQPDMQAAAVCDYTQALHIESQQTTNCFCLHQEADSTSLDLRGLPCQVLLQNSKTWSQQLAADADAVNLSQPGSGAKFTRSAKHQCMHHPLAVLHHNQTKATGMMLKTREWLHPSARQQV